MKYFTSRKSNKLNCPKFGEKGAPNLLTLQIYRFLQNQIASQLSTKHKSDCISTFNQAHLRTYIISLLFELLY
jgi:hypothetical protein